MAGEGVAMFGFLKSKPVETVTVEGAQLRDLEAAGLSRKPAKGREREVVGESQYQGNLRVLAEALGWAPEFRYDDSFAVMWLVREPSNRHDRNAVQLVCGPFVVGYVPRGSAAKLARELDAEGGRRLVAGRLVTDPSKRNAMIGVRWWV
jgi:hypothetical protein